MRFPKKLLLAAAVIAALTQPALADSGPVMKLSRGLTNIVTSPLEFFVQYDSLNATHNPMVSFLGGTIYGTLFTVGRAAVGGFEALTFPFPIPADYASVMDPPTALEAMQAIK